MRISIARLFTSLLLLAIVAAAPASATNQKTGSETTFADPAMPFAARQA